jgi:hypothetical protein
MSEYMVLKKLSITKTEGNFEILLRTGGGAKNMASGLVTGFICPEYSHNRLQSLQAVSSTACTNNALAVARIPLGPCQPALL